MFKMYQSVIIEAKLCLIVNGISGKVRNYGSFLTLVNNC